MTEVQTLQMKRTVMLEAKGAIERRLDQPLADQMNDYENLSSRRGSTLLGSRRRRRDLVGAGSFDRRRYRQDRYHSAKWPGMSGGNPCQGGAGADGR